MRNTRKLFVALVLVMTILMTMAVAVIPASAANISGGTKLYLVPSANWNQSNARFAAYFFGDGEAWVSMTKVAGESNLYEVTSPAGKNFTNVIFCRMNPNASANNWNNKWNQTSDLTYNGSSNCYTVKEGTWDKGGGTWSSYGNSCAHANVGPAATCTTDQVCSDCGDPVASALGHTYNSAHLCTRCNEQASFTVAGDGAHLGTEWDTGNTANDMTYADGVYTKVYTNVAAGSYKLKVARDHDWGTAYPDADKAYTVATAGSTVTVTLKGTTVDIKVEAPHVHDFVEGKCECGELDPNYVPPHVNTLVVGDTNKIVVTGNTLNDYNLPIEWVAFVADEKAHYEFVGSDGALAYIFDANLALISATGAADLEAGNYLICLGNGLVGEFNVAVTKSEIVVAPSLDNLTLWVSNGDLYTVDGYNIKYNGAGNTYACVGTDVTTFAAGNNTFTITITNNGAAIAKVRVDLQATVQVGNHKVVNVSAVGGDVWTDSEWGGSHVHVAPGESVTLVITYDETTERGAVKDLIIFADSGRGDAETYSADITISGLEFSKVSTEEPDDYAEVLVEGENKLLITDALDNGAGYYIVWVPFEATEKANYTFTGDGIIALVYDAAYQAVAGTELEAGTYNVCVAFLTPATTGVATVKVEKTPLSDTPVVEEPTLALGENTVVIDGSETNLTGNAIAWYTFTPEIAGTYKFACSELTVYILTAKNMSDLGSYIGAEGVAELEAGVKYFILVGKDGITGEFALTVESGEIEVPHKNSVALGDNHYIVSDALIATEYEWLNIEITEPGTYLIKGGAPLTVFFFTVPGELGTSSPYGWNIDNITYEYVEEFYVTLTEAGTYWMGFRYDNIGEQREFDFNVSLHEHTFEEGKCVCGAEDPNYVPPHEHSFVDGKCECGESDPNYVPPVEEKPEEKPEETPETPADPQPEEPVVELTFFEKIMKAITDFFAQISAWFENLFAGFKK